MTNILNPLGSTNEALQADDWDGSSSNTGTKLNLLSAAIDSVESVWNKRKRGDALNPGRFALACAAVMR